MSDSLDDKGYISNYLIHWTGKDGDEQGAENLSAIASTRRLLLSYNLIHKYDFTHEVHARMACFTDVPLRHSEAHCSRYGRFGIAFHKLKLMNVGAQPVFYASHACRNDMNTIFSFIHEEMKKHALSEEVFDAFHRHFFFVQRFSDDLADRKDTY